MSGIDEKSKYQASSRVSWGAANVAVSKHKVLIYDLQQESWSIRMIWDHLRAENGLTVNYNAFRAAVSRFNKKRIPQKTVLDAPKPELIREERPEPRPYTNQPTRNKIYESISPEGIDFSSE